MSLSAPIWAGDRLIACLTLIWIASALSFEDALELHAADLQKTASRISGDLPTTEGADGTLPLVG